VGEVFDVAPTRREVVVDHVEMWRVTDGTIVERAAALALVVSSNAR
jgi:hypothetical protein